MQRKLKHALLILVLIGVAVVGTAYYNLVLRPVLVERKIAQVKADFLCLGKAMNYMYVGGGEPGSIFVGEKWSTFDNVPGRRHYFGFAPSLTTPVAYLKSLPHDPFNPRYLLYGYCSLQWKYEKTLFPTPVVLSSYGPDRDLDLNLQQLEQQIAEILSIPIDESLQTRPQAEQCRKHERLILQLIIDNVYDPTNGLISNGDIIQIVGVHRICDWANETPSAPRHKKIIQIF